MSEIIREENSITTKAGAKSVTVTPEAVVSCGHKKSWSSSLSNQVKELMKNNLRLEAKVDNLCGQIEELKGK